MKMQWIKNRQQQACVLNALIVLLMGMNGSAILALGSPLPGLKTCVERLRLKNDLVEEFEFQIKNYPYRYQRRDYVIDIDVWYRYMPDIKKSEYPNVVDIREELILFLQNYPDKYQYWETLNKDVTQMLIEKYSVVTDLEVKFRVYPTDEFPFTRSTIVKRSQHCKQFPSS